MNKKYLIYSIIFICLSSTLYFMHTWYIKQYLDIYAQEYTEYRFGSQHISSEYEAMIRNIAREMNINEEFEIRKMNTQTLQLFGYYNAAAYFPNVFTCIPISNKPFLLISEGFFESLTPEEQRFIIGHELVHIREHHLQYYNLILYLMFIMIVLIWWVITKPLRKFFANFQNKHSVKFGIIYSVLLLWTCSNITTLAVFAYRRHIEWEADRVSLELLNTYNGGIRLMDRWHQEFNMPLHLDLIRGLYADHPSIHERKMYFTSIKNIKENTSCSSKNC